MLLYTQSPEFDTNQAAEGWADIDAEITALFHRGQRGGEFRHDLSATWLTKAFYSLVTGAGWATQVRRNAGPNLTHMITDLMLRGVIRS